ncbi:MAG: cation:dicarboxylase symporter family transporter [Ezakiella sp.]|nr:cation:dicarboxylase symporter family transporter [Ezakiella sp.]MDD7471368.1 cation:dicarboxylase symporter family transporter [Bacillota bacterium]MDY3923537.1 cation:dicarboxylase symporter family transporter [Ezakiella sp.]
MSTTLSAIIIIAIFVAFMFFINYLKKMNVGFNTRTIIALIIGIVFGALLQVIVKEQGLIGKAMSWIGLVGNGYVRLLRMIVYPLIFVSITKAIAMQETNIGKSAGRILLVLMITVAISALVGALISNAFGLTAEGLQSGDSEVARGQKLEETYQDFEAKPIQQQILEIIPVNPFYAMTGQGSNATLATVFFAAMIGFAAFELKKQKSKTVDLFIDFLNSFSDIVMRMVHSVLRITPYGVMALMTGVAATSNFQEILRLGMFIIASYVAIIIMFIIHGIIIGIHGLSPSIFFKKSSSNLMFAFTSRSSAGALPMTITNMTNKLGVPEGIANLAGSLGTSIGQNGCAGIYPAMLAVMIAPTVGINPLSIGFLAKLVIITALGSFGIVGVGGGATFAAIVVLSSMGLPIELAGLLIAIEPLIDMGRTALNVSDSLVAGVVAAKRGNELNIDIYNSKETADI